MDDTAYEKLKERSQHVAMLRSVGAILGWDQETYLPGKGGDYRAEQCALMSALAHQKWAADEVGEWLDTCQQAVVSGADETDRPANVREWKRSYDRARKLPGKFVEELARATSLSQMAWVEARKANSFAQFAPHLEQVVALVRQIPDFVGYQEAPYDALLDEYEPGARTSQLLALFDELEPHLTSLALEGEEASQARPGKLPEGLYPIDKQAAFNCEVAEAFGFDFTAGRIDSAAHPFCTELGPHDIRLTTRYDEADFTNSLYSVLHEAGHGLYEQGLDPNAYGTPCGSSSSLGIHESQSRLWENHIGRTLVFWEHWLPRAATYFPQLASVQPEDIARHVNECRRSFIRVDADELTYDLHVILRLRVEAAIINDGLSVNEIPSVWNDLFHRMFGLSVPDDAHGCLQDVHWSHGSFGYFPTYTLGNLNAAQLMLAAYEALPLLEGELAAGSYSNLLAWLRDNIHRQGSRYLPSNLITKATGMPISPTAHIQHLKDKLAILRRA